MKGTALSRIDHGEVVKDKNIVRVFEAGDRVDLPDETFVQLEAAGAVARMPAAEAAAPPEKDDA